MTFLKIKIKSLAAEARIIRAEEQKWKRLWRSTGTSETPIYQDLRHHRVFELRRAARHALLAYGYLRGRKRSQIEASWPWKDLRNTKPRLIVDGIMKNVERFKPWSPPGWGHLPNKEAVRTQIEEWLKEDARADT